MAVCMQRLLRKKYIDFSRLEETKLARCLSTLDLTALGVGSTLGAGIYVVAGQVARQTAGPSVTISFLIAALASVMAGLCYAEFGARVPKTGSAYVYSYVTVGEVWAFVIGWNLILEYVIGTASVARAWSAYFDSLINGTISKYFQAHVPMHVTSLAPYPDFFALGITLLLTVVLAIGVKESSFFNNIFTGVNMLVVTYIIICGFFKADIHNWQLSPNEIPRNGSSDHTNGDGGFFAFGFSGVMSGAATCFYAFVGFDCIATTGEEVQNPQRAIPISIIVSLFTCFVAYFGISAIITLMVPYYTLDTNAPLPLVFEAVGWGVAKYVIAVGAVCGLSTSLLGAMFPMPRVIYAMASDGLLFRFLATVNERFKTPLYATIIAGILAGVMAMLFDLKELVDMMSIGTLLAYTLVAASVLILRYQPVPLERHTTAPDGEPDNSLTLTQYDTGMGAEPQGSYTTINGDMSDKPLRWWQKLFVPPNTDPSHTSSTVVKYAVLLLGIFMACFDVLIIFLEGYLATYQWWAILLSTVFLSIVVILVVIIWRQPQNLGYVTFKVPCMPILPVVSIFVNVYLMLKLSALTWIRFGVWLFVGSLIYFGYGIWHSSEEIRMKQSMSPLGHTDSEPTESPTVSHNENTQLIRDK